MAVNTEEQQGTSRRTTQAGDTDDDVRSAFATARQAAESAASTVAAQAPEVANATRGAVADAMQRMEGGSDQALATGAAFALGAALGLLVGGGPRILVAATLVPVAAAGMILLDRRNGATRSTSR
jgi:hypothetical protein